MENWKRVKDWNYEVSDQGRVRSTKGRILSVRYVIGGDYKYVVVYIPNVGRRLFLIARMMLIAFVGPGVGKRVGFKNGNRRDLRLENLEWSEPEGRNCFVYHDDFNRPSKLTWDQVRDIRRQWNENKKLSASELARAFGVDNATVTRIVYNKTWREE